MTTSAHLRTDQEKVEETDLASGVAHQVAKEPEYGLYAVLACVLVLAALDGMAVLIFSHNVSNAVALIGAMSSPIVGMVSAYFGVKLGVRTGTADAAAATEARRRAEIETKSLLGHMPPEQAKPLMQQLGIPVTG